MHHPTIHICQHPLLQHNLAIIRDKNSNREQFRAAINKVTQYILHNATGNLPLTSKIITTPLTETEARVLDSSVPIIISPVMRAGLAMADVMMDLIPSASVYHLGLYRDEKTYQPITYYNKLHSNLDYQNARIFILDPMLATGGSILAALKIFQQCGAIEKNITIACMIAAPEGIQAVSHAFPNITMFTGAVDQKLNENAYIVPGLGDAGDRIFGTL